MSYFFRPDERPSFAVVEPRLRDYYYDISQWPVICWKKTQTEESLSRSCLYMVLRTGHTDLFDIIYLQAYPKAVVVVFVCFSSQNYNQWVTACLGYFPTCLQTLQLAINSKLHFHITITAYFFYHRTILYTILLYLNMTLFSCTCFISSILSEKVPWQQHSKYL